METTNNTANEPALPKSYVLHHKNDNPYDKDALRQIARFIDLWPKKRHKALLKHLLKTNQTYAEFDAFVVITDQSLTFRKSVKEVYMDGLFLDAQYPSFLRIWRKNGVTNYCCAPDFSVYADYDGDVFDSKGHLKEEVKQLAIAELKENLLVTE